jgi:molybdenum cofactor cytidylyltransferase
MKVDFSWRLPGAFSLSRHALVAIVGGGGKSSLMFALGAQLSSPVILTTTTRIFAAQMSLAVQTLIFDPDQPEMASVEQIIAAAKMAGHCLVVGAVEGEKARGVPPELPAALQQRAVMPVLVEADGSRMRPVKAPAAHEPVIPPGSSHVIPVIGIDALAGPLLTVAHRPELIARLLGIETLFGGRDHQLTPADVAVLLAHPDGGAKNVPEGAQFIPFINKVETAPERHQAAQIAAYLLHEPRVARVVIGRLQPEPMVHEVWRRVTAVVLAAGRGRRMGRVKQLLPWGERTVLGQTVRTLQQSSVQEILVVTGHARADVEAEAVRLGVSTVHNPDYAAGEMISSLQTAVRALPANVDAVLVVLADQPMVPVAVIEQLLDAFRAHDVGLVAPFVGQRRGNPVLIERRHFAELLTLTTEQAPRHLLRRHEDGILAVDVGETAVLRDIDSPESYAREYEAWLRKQ